MLGRNAKASKTFRKRKKKKGLGKLGRKIFGAKGKLFPWARHNISQVITVLIDCNVLFVFVCNIK